MKILIIGGGAFGTSMAQQLAANSNNCIQLLFQSEKETVSFNNTKINGAYFPNLQLHERIEGINDWKELEQADIVFVAVPAKSIQQVCQSIKPYLRPETLLVNLAKGLYLGGKTIVEYLKEELNHNHTVTLKGPSFAAEMINSQATLLTLGFEKREQLNLIKTITRDTNLYLDYTSDIRGVELLSALKNVYAILLGNVDARHNSANTRFLVLTKMFFEIKIILKYLGGRPETVNLGCGIGDINLTALNDLSRNRTLGLLIGKGFYNKAIEDNYVVVEGLKTLNLVKDLIPQNLMPRLPLLQQLLDFFMQDNPHALNLDFERLFEPQYKTVLTYGTFDLLHFGHLEILRRAKELGDELIVGLSTDEFNKGKGKVCKFSYDKRKAFLESLSYVDLVIPETAWEQKVEDVQNYDVDTFVMGHDWTGKFDFLKAYCEVHYFPRTDGISTTKIKKMLEKNK